MMRMMMTQDCSVAALACTRTRVTLGPPAGEPAHDTEAALPALAGGYALRETQLATHTSTCSHMFMGAYVHITFVTYYFRW